MNFIYVNIIASVAIVFCIIIRSIFINKMPKKVFKIIWAIIIVRLIFPKLPSINTIIFQIKSVVPIKNIQNFYLEQHTIRKIPILIKE